MLEDRLVVALSNIMGSSEISLQLQNIQYNNALAYTIQKIRASLSLVYRMDLWITNYIFSINKDKGPTENNFKITKALLLVVRLKDAAGSFVSLTGLLETDRKRE